MMLRLMMLSGSSAATYRNTNPLMAMIVYVTSVG